MQGIDVNQVITLVQELKHLIRKIEGTEDENGLVDALDCLIVDKLPKVLENHQIFDDRGIKTLGALNIIVDKLTTFNDNFDASFEMLGKTIAREQKDVLLKASSVSKQALNELQVIRNELSGVANNIDFSIIKEKIKTAVGDSFANQVEFLNKTSTQTAVISKKMHEVAAANDQAISNFNQMIKSFNLKLLIGVGVGCLLVGVGIGAVGGVYATDRIAKEYLHNDLVMSKTAYEEKLEELKEVYRNSQGLEKFVQENNILVNYGIFKDTTTPYVYFKIKQLETAPNLMFDRDGNRYIAFKQK